MKKLLLLMMTVTTWWAAQADSYVVTSNADSGPGSFRAALLLANANGTAIEDIIRFNLPNTTEAGRTIALLSPLPALTSNITIDASTQPGTPLGISTAMVTLVAPDISPFIYLLIEKAEHVSIYSLCFRTANAQAMQEHYAIGLKGSKDITIGDAAKGNLFTVVRNAISNKFVNHTNDSAIDVRIQGNVFGLYSNNTPAGGGHITLTQAAGITLGDLDHKGNLFVGSIIDIHQSPVNSHPSFISVRDNKFNQDWTGSRYYDEPAALYLTGNTTDDIDDTKTYLTGNHFNSTAGIIGITRLYHKTIITGNKLGTDMTGTTCRPRADISFDACRNVRLGGHDPGEENIINGTVYTQRNGIYIIRNRLSDIRMNSYAPGDPFITIATYDNGTITGKAPPLSSIQLYTNDCRAACAGKTWLATVAADAAGNWTFPYAAGIGNIVGTATTPDSSTSVFSTVSVDDFRVTIKPSTCGKPAGDITGIDVRQGTHISWTRTSDLQVVSRTAHLQDALPGRYTLRVTNGADGCDYEANYEVPDMAPPPGYNANMKYAYCGQNIGSLWIQPAGFLSYQWMNSQQEIIADGNAMSNLYPDNYYLKAWVTNDPTCNKTYGPYRVLNINGPTLEAPARIDSATCGQPTGSIQGITFTDTQGDLFLQWIDERHQPLGNRADLIHVKPGRYRLRYKDQAICDTAYSPWYTVPDKGTIRIDETAVHLSPAKCNGGGGSITGLAITGGDTCQWLDGDDKPVAHTPEAGDLPAGAYRLKVTSQAGCEAVTSSFIIPTASFATINVLRSDIGSPACGQPTGFAQPQAFTADSNYYSFRWIDKSTGQEVSTRTGFYGQLAGTYHLHATDTNHCESVIYEVILGDRAAPAFDYSKVTVKDDACALRRGSITGIQISGIQGAATYAWQNERGSIIGNDLQLQQAAAGIYTLYINDPLTCTVSSRPFTLGNNNNLPPLAYDDQVIPRNKDATLSPKAPSEGSYRLYADAGATQLLQENDRGSFTIRNVPSDTAYYIQQSTGDCLSGTTRVKITVVDRSFFSIPNAFTPNHDGNNDRLNVRVTGAITLSYFRIYSRWGQLVFESKSAAEGWDGNWHQRPQPTGTYVWVAEGIDLLGNPIRQKGNFLLIR